MDEEHGLNDIDYDLTVSTPIGVKLKIDDRALRFTGNWGDFPMERLRGFQTCGAVTMTTKFDREIFFDNVRDDLFDGALTQQQVDGCSVILGLWEGQYTGTPMTDIRWLAYILATVYHECATTMWPITEYGSQSYLQGKDY